MPPVVGQGEPLHVFFVTCFLRQHVGRPLLGDGALPQAEEGRLLAVAIVVVGATAQPGHVLELARQDGAIAYAVQFTALLIGVDVGAEHHRAVVHNGELLHRYEAHRALLALVEVREAHIDRCAVVLVFSLLVVTLKVAQPLLVPAFLVVVLAAVGCTEDVQFEQGIGLFVDEPSVLEEDDSLIPSADASPTRSLSARNREASIHVLCLHLFAVGIRGHGHLRHVVESAQFKLLACHLVAFLRPEASLLLANAETHGRVTGVDRQLLSRHTFPVALLQAIVDIDIVDVVVLPGRAELALVLLRHLAVVQHEVNGLVDLFHFKALRRDTVVGEHHAVEHDVVGTFTEVAAIEEVLAFVEAVVLELPDKLARQCGIVFVEVVVFALAAKGVATSTVVLAHDERLGALATLHFFLSLPRITLHGTEAGIHAAVGHGIVGVALVVGDTCRIVFGDAVGHIAEIVSTAALVAKRPAEDGGMVAQRQHLSYVALHHGLAED